MLFDWWVCLPFLQDNKFRHNEVSVRLYVIKAGSGQSQCLWKKIVTGDVYLLTQLPNH